MTKKLTVANVGEQTLYLNGTPASGMPLKAQQQITFTDAPESLSVAADRTTKGITYIHNTGNLAVELDAPGVVPGLRPILMPGDSTGVEQGRMVGVKALLPPAQDASEALTKAAARVLELEEENRLLKGEVDQLYAGNKSLARSLDRRAAVEDENSRLRGRVLELETALEIMMRLETLADERVSKLEDRVDEMPKLCVDKTLQTIAANMRNGRITNV